MLFPPKKNKKSDSKKRNQNHHRKIDLHSSGNPSIEGRIKEREVLSSSKIIKKPLRKLISSKKCEDVKSDFKQVHGILKKLKEKQ